MLRPKHRMAALSPELCTACPVAASSLTAPSCRPRGTGSLNIAQVSLRSSDLALTIFSSFVGSRDYSSRITRFPAWRSSIFGRRHRITRRRDDQWMISFLLLSYCVSIVFCIRLLFKQGLARFVSHIYELGSEIGTGTE